MDAPEALELAAAHLRDPASSWSVVKLIRLMS